ncbi:4Fe-4S dicluster domain-containing protein [Sporolituus thermophilus]|uniref:Fe-S-cluster-containing hydrogenase component 2 n=1 Tax=Sporolituus thermophilus DSM 23256 TaxID=1123285 RepID=A0A1G7MD02_9FIRM|nr:4Fe-4S dicluster domain-containing protein [Sporolituus thermophilus]SDF59504.1 Fe-S-cluster-containing hydrogenase component 2 [Sporolituus thermophilus DSM 23256]
MSENEKKPEGQNEQDSKYMFFTRREFVIGAVTGAAVGSVITGVATKGGGSSTPAKPDSSRQTGEKKIKVPSYIAVNYAKCTGCRICEAECALFHYKTPDLSRSRIKVYYFNPPVDVPSLCAKCGDAPCIKACPEKVGALSKDKTTGAVILDEKKCIACWACIEPCAKDRVGVIRKSKDEKVVVGICDLCGGDPTCVKSCREGALSIVPVYQDGKYFAAKPADIARAVGKNLYKA